MDKVNDEHIIQLLSSPSTMNRGFSLFMDKYQEGLYWHVRRIVLSHENANDVMQNTMIKVYKNIGRFKGESKLFTWVYRIATNESISFLKKQKKHLSYSIEDQAIVVNELRSDPYFNGDEAKEKLLSSIKTLPERQQLVFNMRYFEAMPYADISKILNVSQGALKASFHHAAKKIQAMLKQKTYGG